MRKSLLLILVTLLLTACGTTSAIEIDDSSSQNKTEAKGTDNVYEFRDPQTNNRLGDLILNDDNTIEIIVDNSDVTYVGYVEPYDFSQNYHIVAAKPHTNWTQIAEGKDDNIYFIDCDAIICDYAEDGSECFFSTLIESGPTSEDPTTPCLFKEGKIIVGGQANVNPDENKPKGYFARYITIIDENNNELCKMAQVHNSDGYIISGDLKLDDISLSKGDAIFYSKDRHIYGPYENTLTFMVMADDEEKDIELTLACVDPDNGLYKIKSHSLTTANDVANFVKYRYMSDMDEDVTYYDQDGNVLEYEDILDWNNGL
ncbi:hypothetical protein SAMN04487830_101105 [Pseudobutyrivibrio sp. OR37]|uniref:hypothetical protein n=1 Tax=Pseudobutyrivibrio sp. OR37 TaxID=1798186 RepID=UPI0008DEEF29|nr:hypothetical protein [Pseudobutyrivibrio sp. OR37]SFH53407.1 hypothetical protein SAMN04487830_101105 [Pseudobutyrivibrio sp. OR37]